MMRRSIALLALAGAGAAACDPFPTGLPSWEQTWAVPGESVELSVAELLPPEVTLNADSSAFVTEVPATSVSVTLGEMCGCPGSAGLAVPKPAFSYTLNTSSTFPADLVTATLADGTLGMELAHDFNFDPLNPSADPAAPKGSLTITVTSDGAVVTDTTISGATTTFSSGTTLSPTLAIQPVDVGSELQIAIDIDSPAGDDTTFEASDSLGVALLPSTIEISEIEVTATSITLDGTTTTMDFSGVEEDGFLVERIQRGSLIFDIQNPFTVTGSLALEFQLPAQSIERTLPISQGSYEASLNYTGEELRSILGSDQVDLVTSGTVGSATGTLTIRPDQVLIMDSRFQVVLLVGGMENE